MAKPMKYLQTALTGANPRERHLCKLPCKGSRPKLFGFFRNETPGPCHSVDSYDVQDVFPKAETLGARWNPHPCKRWAAN